MYIKFKTKLHNLGILYISGKITKKSKEIIILKVKIVVTSRRKREDKYGKRRVEMLLGCWQYFGFFYLDAGLSFIFYNKNFI